MYNYYTGLGLATLILLAGCQGVKVDNDEEILTRREQKYKDLGHFFGDDTFTFGGNGERTNSKPGEVGIGVNSYLWRASLDTLSFMPLLSVDPFGGVILTNWVQSASSPQERLKVDVLILGRQLRTDGLKVTVFQQRLVKDQWIDQPLQTDVGHQLEDLILTRARQLKIQSGK